MKFFGITRNTKKELEARCAKLEAQLTELEGSYVELADKYYKLVDVFPFVMGQEVYDIALKSAQGRYTTLKPSLEHSTITPVVVSEKNYFKLVTRYMNNDVFNTYEEALEYLQSICK